jgi:hypothetical protein
MGGAILAAMAELYFYCAGRGVLCCAGRRCTCYTGLLFPFEILIFLGFLYLYFVNIILYLEDRYDHAYAEGYSRARGER